MSSRQFPTISVIIPAYNQANFLPRAIESVLSQTYKDYEIIVVDDGSTDDTSNEAQKFADAISYIRQENRGLAGARNTGIRAAKGRFIGLLDSDDEWLPGYLEKMLALASSSPDAAVYYCSAQSVDVDGNPLPQVFGGPRLPPDQLYPALVRANFLIPSTILMRSDVINAVGLFDESLRSCEDWDLWLRLLPDHKFAGIDETLILYRIHGSSLSTDPSGMQQAARTVIYKHFGADDGNTTGWTELKKGAFGGLYTYHAWTSILRKKDWEAGGRYIFKALSADPSLVTSLDFFYEILLGSQPVGYRGTSTQLDLEHNMQELHSILDEISLQIPFSQQPSARRKLYGTAYYAAGLLAYNSQNNGVARQYFELALRYQGELWLDRRVLSLYIKSRLPSTLKQGIKKLVSRGS